MINEKTVKTRAIKIADDYVAKVTTKLKQKEKEKAKKAAAATTAAPAK